MLCAATCAWRSTGWRPRRSRLASHTREAGHESAERQVRDDARREEREAAGAGRRPLPSRAHAEDREEVARQEPGKDQGKEARLVRRERRARACEAKGVERRAPRRDRMIAARRDRIANDPEYHEKIKAQKRDLYHRNKDGAKFLRWYLKSILIPRWRRIDCDEAERKYLARCNDRTRRLYMLWKRDTYGAMKKLTGEDA